MYIYESIYIYNGTCVYHVYICMYMNTSLRLYAYTHSYMYTYVHTYMYNYVCTKAMHNLLQHILQRTATQWDT